MNPDFVDLVSAFNAGRVEYLIDIERLERGEDD